MVSSRLRLARHYHIFLNSACGWVYCLRSKDGPGWVGLARLDGHGLGLRRGKPCVSATAGRLRNSQRRGSAPTPVLLGHPQACLPAAALPQGVP